MQSSLDGRFTLFGNEVLTSSNPNQSALSPAQLPGRHHLFNHFNIVHRHGKNQLLSKQLSHFNGLLTDTFTCIVLLKTY